MAQLWSSLGVRLGRNVAYSTALDTKIRLNSGPWQGLKIWGYHGTPGTPRNDRPGSVVYIPADRTGDCRYAQKTNLVHSVYQFFFSTVIWSYWLLPVILIDLKRTSVLDYLRMKFAWLIINLTLFIFWTSAQFLPEITSLNISFPLRWGDFCEKHDLILLKSKNSTHVQLLIKNV